jgi:3'-5' exonuclease
MIKHFSPATCAFDCEWVPCPTTARRLLALPPGCSDREATEAVWRAYAREDGERPFLKLVLCKVVTIAALFRAATPEGHIQLELFSQDCDAHGEAHLITTFLERVAGGGLQLWGYNSASSDLPILKQRAIALDAPLPKFFKRPPKPWEGMDYHAARNSDAHIDILEQIGAFGGGAAKPKLHELALACGFPGKLDVRGGDVAELYLEGRIAAIREYNETDAVTTHLLMLRLAHVAGLLPDEPYRGELLAVEKLVKAQAAAGKAQFAQFWTAWKGAGSGAALPGSEQEPGAPHGEEKDAEQAARLQAHWKEFLAQIKAEHGPQLVAALNAVRGFAVDSGAVTLYFGSNEFSRNLCRQQAQVVAAHLAAFLALKAVTAEFQMGEAPGC